MASNPVRPLITILMDLLVVLAVLVTASIVVAFFGALSSQGWGDALLTIARLVTIPFGIAPAKTPYGGVFMVDAAVTVGVFLLFEWGLAVLRQRP